MTHPKPDSESPAPGDTQLTSPELTGPEHITAMLAHAQAAKAAGMLDEEGYQRILDALYVPPENSNTRAWLDAQPNRDPHSRWLRILGVVEDVLPDGDETSTPAEVASGLLAAFGIDTKDTRAILSFRQRIALACERIRYQRRSARA